jgi:hypothetical protein
VLKCTYGAIMYINSKFIFLIPGIKASRHGVLQLQILNSEKYHAIIDMPLNNL